MNSENKKDRGRLSVMHISKHSFCSWRLLSQDRGRLPDKHIFQAFAQKLAHVLASLVRTAKEKGAVGTSTRADACAFTSDPQLSSYRRRFKTGENREKLAHMRTMIERHKTNPFFGLSLFGSLGLVVRTWKHEVRGVIASAVQVGKLSVRRACHPST